MRNVRWNIDEIAGASFVDKFEIISPAKARTAANHVNDGFQFAVVVRTGLGVGMHDDRSGPKLLRAYFGMGDGFGTSHARSLRCVGVQLAASDDAQAMNFPVWPCSRDRVAHDPRPLNRAAASSHGWSAIIHRSRRCRELLGDTFKTRI